MGGHPQGAIRCFGQCVNRRARKPVRFAKRGESGAVVAKKTVLRAHPQVTRPILIETLRRKVAETLFLAVVLETVALGESRGYQQRKYEYCFTVSGAGYQQVLQ
jgi:hypothetical protein